VLQTEITSFTDARGVVSVLITAALRNGLLKQTNPSLTVNLEDLSTPLSDEIPLDVVHIAR
jgi:hypothetical protein